MKLKLQKLSSVLITFNVSVNDSLYMKTEDLKLKPLKQVKNNIVSVSLNGEGEELNIELYASVYQVL